MKSRQAVGAAIIVCICIGLTYWAVASTQRRRARAETTALVISDANAELVDRLDQYPNLEILTIHCVESLQSLPDSIGSLTHLKVLDLDNGNGCSMNPRLPESIGNLRSLEMLVLTGAQDPREPGPQPAIRHRFPRSMSQLKRLTYLDLGRNGMEEIPEFVADLPRLKELGFSWNMQIKRLPVFLTRMPELQTLRLDSDGLTDLPNFLNEVPKLTRITLGDNCDITQSPAKQNELKRKFPRITLDFQNEYDCQPLK